MYESFMFVDSGQRISAEWSHLLRVYPALDGPGSRSAILLAVEWQLVALLGKLR